MSKPRLGPTGEGPTFLTGDDSGSGGGWIDYDFAVIRAVPHVHLDTHVNVGVVVHGRKSGFLAAKVVESAEVLGGMVRATDVELMAEYLRNLAGVAAGDEECGPMALLPHSERFHWLTAPRSDVIQSSRARPGRSRDLDATLESLFAEYVDLPD